MTHDAVLTEVLTYFSGAGAHARTLAATMVRDALHDMLVVTVDRPLFLAGLERYEQRPDKEYSLVDCMSMIVMEQRGIRHVLTNDHHFSQAGFVVVNQ
ncbi:MAG TPA: nucleic acid-binding protein [Thermoanaerobaculia bacterium]